MAAYLHASLLYFRVPPLLPYEGKSETWFGEDEWLWNARISALRQL